MQHMHHMWSVSEYQPISWHKVLHDHACSLLRNRKHAGCHLHIYLRLTQYKNINACLFCEIQNGTIHVAALQRESKSKSSPAASGVTSAISTFVCQLTGWHSQSSTWSGLVRKLTLQCTVATAASRSSKCHNILIMIAVWNCVLYCECEPCLQQHVNQLKFVNQLNLRQAHVCLQVHECKPSRKHAEADYNLEWCDVNKWEHLQLWTVPPAQWLCVGNVPGPFPSWEEVDHQLTMLAPSDPCLA